MALLQSIEDKQFAAQVKALKENVAELIQVTKEQNELISKLLEKMPK